MLKFNATTVEGSQKTSPFVKPIRMRLQTHSYEDNGLTPIRKKINSFLIKSTKFLIYSDVFPPKHVDIVFIVRNCLPKEKKVLPTGSSHVQSLFLCVLRIFSS